MDGVVSWWNVSVELSNDKRFKSWFCVSLWKLLPLASCVQRIRCYTSKVSPVFITASEQSVNMSSFWQGCFFWKPFSVCSVHRLKRGWVTGWNLFTLTVCVIARPREEQTLLVYLLNQPNSHVYSFIYCQVFSRASRIQRAITSFSKTGFHIAEILLSVASMLLVNLLKHKASIA